KMTLGALGVAAAGTVAVPLIRSAVTGGSSSDDRDTATVSDDESDSDDRSETNGEPGSLDLPGLVSTAGSAI
ncbi:unnamed protein product, partial [Allacma fusca]